MAGPTPRVDSEISVLQFKDVLKIFLLSFIFFSFSLSSVLPFSLSFFLCIPLLRNLQSPSCLEGIENCGVPLSCLSDIFPVKFLLAGFKLRCQGISAVFVLFFLWEKKG